MPKKRTRHISKDSAGTKKRRPSTPHQRRLLAASSLSERSQAARNRALHVLAAMRRDAKLSLTHAAKFEGIKPATVRKYFPQDLKKSEGKLRVVKRDRHTATIYLPDSSGEIVPRETRSSKERSQASKFLRDLGRYARGARNSLPSWKNKKIGGIDLLTDPQTIRETEPALSDLSLYRSFNGRNE